MKRSNLYVFIKRMGEKVHHNFEFYYTNAEFASEREGAQSSVMSHLRDDRRFNTNNFYRHKVIRLYFYGPNGKKDKKKA